MFQVLTAREFSGRSFVLGTPDFLARWSQTTRNLFY
jgi:hypothetical protein